MLVTIKYELQVLGWLHIGSGWGTGAVKRPLLKTSNNDFIIPGSTIKGRVRFYCYEFSAACDDSFFSCEDVDQVFGRPGDSGRGLEICAFSDLQAPAEQPMQLCLRNGIAISRRTGVTKPHALFNTEIATYPETASLTGQGKRPVFQGQIRYYQQEGTPRHVALLLVGLSLLRRLGGSKTIGGGCCQVPLSSVTLCWETDPHIKLGARELLAEYLEGSVA